MRRKIRLTRGEMKRKNKKIMISISILLFLFLVGYGAFQTTLNLNITGKIKIPTECIEGKMWEFSQKNEGQEFKVPCSGEYKVELWGASGNNNYNEYTYQFKVYGGYVSGKINLKMGQKIYAYVGGEKKTFNCCSKQGTNAGSGGATDIRILKTEKWDDFASLKTRIIVAGGAGGSYTDSTAPQGGIAGGLESYTVSHKNHPVDKSTQIKAGNAGYRGTSGTFGKGGINSENNYNSGAGGYYGGGSGPAGGGGSSFISGHDGCDAISEQSTEDNIIHTGQSIHYSGLHFTDTVMIDGAGYKWTDHKLDDLGVVGMPTHSGIGTIIGNEGDGFAKITLLTRKPN